MMKPILNLPITVSRRWWGLLLICVLNFASFAILFALEGEFEAITNSPVYDTQNDLTTDTILQQLPLYVGEARAAYDRFAAFDFVFPLVAAVFVAVLWALLLRLNNWPIAQRLLRGRFYLLALLVTLWDWLENVSFLAILSAGNTPLSFWLDAAIFFKRLKLIGLSASGLVTVLLLVLLIANLVYRFSRRNVSVAARHA